MSRLPGEKTPAKNAQAYFRRSGRDEATATQIRKEERAADAAKMANLRRLRLEKEAAGLKRKADESIQRLRPEILRLLRERARNSRGQQKKSDEERVRGGRFSFHVRSLLSASRIQRRIDGYR